MTLGTMRQNGTRWIEAYCLEISCGDNGLVHVDHLPDDLPVPDIALRLCCLSCGSKNVRTEPRRGICGTGGATGRVCSGSQAGRREEPGLTSTCGLTINPTQGNGSMAGHIIARLPLRMRCLWTLRLRCSTYDAKSDWAQSYRTGRSARV